MQCQDCKSHALAHVKKKTNEFERICAGTRLILENVCALYVSEFVAFSGLA